MVQQNAEFLPEDNVDPNAITEEPEREIPYDTPDAGTTLSEEEEGAQHLSDLQAVLRSLHIRYKDEKLNEYAQSVASSRVFPDNFWAKHRLIVTALVEEYAEDDKKDLDIVSIVSSVQDALSIGFEGRGRIEDLEVAGIAHEEELEKLSKDLGIG